MVTVTSAGLGGAVVVGLDQPRRDVVLAEHLDHALGRAVPGVHARRPGGRRRASRARRRRRARGRRGSPRAGRRDAAAGPSPAAGSPVVEAERADRPPGQAELAGCGRGRRRARGTTRRRGRSGPCRLRLPRPSDAPRNSSLVATRSWARLRTRSGSTTTTWVSSGIASTSSSSSSTRTGASDSIPSTAMPAAILSVISASCGWASPSAAARRRTSSVSSSSRHGGAHSRSTFSMVRWSATANERISSTSSPQNSTRTGCCSVGGKTSTSPPRTANSPRFSTRSTRVYAASARPAYDVVERRRCRRAPAPPARGRRGRSPAAAGSTGPARRRPAAARWPRRRPGGAAGAARPAAGRRCRCAG